MCIILITNSMYTLVLPWSFLFSSTELMSIFFSSNENIFLASKGNRKSLSNVQCKGGIFFPTSSQVHVTAEILQSALGWLQYHRRVEVLRQISGPTPWPKEGHIEPLAWDHVHVVFDYLQPQKPHYLRNNPCQCFVTLTVKKRCFLMLRETYTFPFVPSASGPVIGHPWPEPGFCTLPSDTWFKTIHGPDGPWGQYGADCSL